MGCLYILEFDPLLFALFANIFSHCVDFLFMLFMVSFGASLVAQMVKNQPAMQETWVRSLGQEDPPDKGMATHSSILQRVGHD